MGPFPFGCQGHYLFRVQGLVCNTDVAFSLLAIRATIYTHTNTHNVCVCVCVRERERERERECVVCVCVVCECVWCVCVQRQSRAI
jgi:hypothetical protein